MLFIDTHTHISDPAFKGEEEKVIQRALDAGVYKMLLADIDSSERQAMYSLCAKYPGCLYPMLGLYPGSVKENWQEEMDKIMELSKLGGFIAIGEVGLDYHYGKEFAAEQLDALVCQFELASKLNMPLNIHLREATDDFFKALEACKGLALRGNLHAFSGSAQTYKRLQKYGQWSVGIGGVLTFKKASIAQEVLDIPLEAIVLETDAPYLAPTPKRGSRNESENIPIIAEKLSEIKKIDIQIVAEKTTKNALELFPLISE